MLLRILGWDTFSGMKRRQGICRRQMEFLTPVKKWPGIQYPRLQFLRAF